MESAFCNEGLSYLVDEIRTERRYRESKVLEDTQILKRTTEPTTVYKKTDRDEMIDITDFEFLEQLLQGK